MKKLAIFLVVFGIGIVGVVGVAGTLTCDGSLFTSGERIGASQGEVANACGYPVSRTFTHWVYIINNTRYVLTFGGDGLLVDVRSTPVQ